MKKSTFNDKVYNIVKQIPHGKVTSYGQIAALIGSPRAARAVGWAMHQMDTLPLKKYCWWRVINSKGFISTTCSDHTFEIQKQLLEKDGVEVYWNKKKKMYQVDIEKYQWKI